MNDQGRSVTRTRHLRHQRAMTRFEKIREANDTCDTFSGISKCAPVTGDTFAVVTPHARDQGLMLRTGHMRHPSPLGEDR